ncbi:MAG: AlpA family phage regulatory protein [Castellaniella sp.]|uniref:helix-turn-helix transcriptional regulator n=1 Tax=Castellaniella sp. TaxID=1955812 RepID=UPI003C718999
MAQATTQQTTHSVTKAQAQQAAASAYSAPADERLITDKEVAHLLGSCRSWPWKLAQGGRFPQPIKLTPKFTRWRLSEVRAWMNNPDAWQAKNAGA